MQPCKKKCSVNLSGAKEGDKLTPVMSLESALVVTDDLKSHEEKKKSGGL